MSQYTTIARGLWEFKLYPVRNTQSMTHREKILLKPLAAVVLRRKSGIREGSAAFFLPLLKAVHMDVRCEIKISLFICPRVSFHHLNVVIFGNKIFYAKQHLGGVCSFWAERNFFLQEEYETDQYTCFQLKE